MHTIPYSQGMSRLARTALLMASLSTLAACGSSDQNNATQQSTHTAVDGNNAQNGNAQNGNGTLSNTQAATLAAAATQVSDPNTGSMVTQGQQMPACQEIATQVGETIAQAMQALNQNQDCTAQLEAFITEITQLAQCVQNNASTAGGNVTIAGGNLPAGGGNVLPFSVSPNDCNTTMDANNTVVTTCTGSGVSCSSVSDAAGSTTQSCSSGGATGDANGFPMPQPGDANGLPVPPPVPTPGPQPSMVPNGATDGNVVTVVHARASRGLPANLGQACRTQRSQQTNAIVVTCQCSSAAGNCNR